MVRKQLILLFSVILLCGLCAYYLHLKNTGENSNLSLSIKEEIIEETKFRFKPVIEKKGDTNTIKLLIDVTSYIYPHFLTKNYSEVIVIEFEETSFMPTNWKVIEKNNHRLIGQLEFIVNNKKIVDSFDLKLFIFGEVYEIIWN